jgi:hypothetical protein
MYKENMDLQKNLDRLENLLLHICGCTKKEAQLVAETFLKELYFSKEERDIIKSRRNKEYEEQESI